jgi:hypothetical protein
MKTAVCYDSFESNEARAIRKDFALIKAILKLCKKVPYVHILMHRQQQKQTDDSDNGLYIYVFDARRHSTTTWKKMVKFCPRNC